MRCPDHGLNLPCRWPGCTPKAANRLFGEFPTQTEIQFSRHLLSCDHCIVAYLAMKEDGFCDDGAELAVQAGVITPAAQA